jgi:hypothetical protein
MLVSDNIVVRCTYEVLNGGGYLEARKHWDFIFFEMQHRSDGPR